MPVMPSDRDRSVAGCVMSVLRRGRSPGCASRMPGTSIRLRRSATDPSGPRSLPCQARSETIDLDRSEGRRGRLRIRSSWIETVSVTGRGEVSERVRIGCSQRASASAGSLRRARLMQAGHIQPSASERQRPVSASISSLSGNVRNDRPGPLRRQTWQMTHSESMVRHRTEHRSRRGLRTGAGRLHRSHRPQSEFQP
jgi:hypothetical protein